MQPPHVLTDFIKRKGPSSRKDALVIMGACLGGLLLVAGIFTARIMFLFGTEAAFENRTLSDVTILVDHNVWLTLEPGESETVGDEASFWDDEHLVEAIEQGTGRVLYAKRLDGDALEKMENRVVIAPR